MTRSKLSNLGAVLLEDWLVKSPPYAKINQIVSWRRRYFALLQIKQENQNTRLQNLSKKGPKSLESLHDVYLVYWNTKYDMENGGKPIKAIPLLKGYTVDMRQPPVFKATFHHVFLLDTIERKYYLCADDEEKKQNWHDALVQAIESRHEAPSVDETKKEPIYEIIHVILKETGDTGSLSSQSSSSSNRMSSVSSSSSVTDNVDFEQRKLSHVSLGQTSSSELPTVDESDYVEMKSLITSPESYFFPLQKNNRSDRRPEPDEGKSIANIGKSSMKMMECATVSDMQRTVQFSDITFEIPVSSEIQFEENTFRVITPRCTCVVSMQKKRGVSFT